MEISILMPVYNAEEYVAEAIESTLKQSFGDFEFLIIDDGSTDNTQSIIRSYKDERINVITNEHNLVKSLNLGLNKSKGKYIARMDADDIMHIDRLRMQYEIMEEEPSITVCGSWMRVFGEDVHEGGIMKNGLGLIDFPLLLLMKENFIYYPTAMMRNSFLKENKIKYSENYKWAEDYKLWFDISSLGGRFFIDSETLLYHRVYSKQVRVTKNEEQTKIAMRIRNEILNYLIAQSDERFKLSELNILLKTIKDAGILSDKEINILFYTIFLKKKAIIGD